MALRRARSTSPSPHQAVFIDVGQTGLQRLGQCGSAFQADHLQRAGHLVCIVARQAQGVGQVGIDAVCLDASQGSLQGGVDVSAHPVQRAGIVVE